MGQQRLRTEMGLIFSVWVYFQICFKGRPLCAELASLLCIWINIVFSMGFEFLRELCVNYKLALAKSICLVFPGTSVSKESSHNAGDPGWIPGSRRFPGEGNGKPLWYSCQENSRKRGAWITSARAFTICLCCWSCWPLTLPEVNSGWWVRHSVLQGNRWNRSLDSWIFSGIDFMIPMLASPHI